MRIGRLGIDAPIFAFYFDKAACGCLIAYTPVGCLTWFSKDCKCQLCSLYSCGCKCPLCNNGYVVCDCEKFE